MEDDELLHPGDHVAGDDRRLGGVHDAIEDVTVDPDNHNMVYAATGDISFGSFSFGSAGDPQEHRPRCDLDDPWHEHVHAHLPALDRGHVPAVPGGDKVRVDPNASNKVVAGTKTGVSSRTTPASLDRRLQAQRLLEPAPGHHRPPAGHGATTKVFAAVGARGFATPVQQNLDKNGANGVYVLHSMPASGCPARPHWTTLTSGWPAGTAGGGGVQPADRGT